MDSATWLLVGEYRLEGTPTRAMWITGTDDGPRSYSHAVSWFRRDVYLTHFDSSDLSRLLGRSGAESVVIEDVRLYRVGPFGGWHRVTT